MAETVPIFQPFPTEALVGQGKLVLLASIMFCYQRENRMRQSDLRNLHVALSTQSQCIWDLGIHCLKLIWTRVSLMLTLWPPGPEDLPKVKAEGHWDAETKNGAMSDLTDLYRNCIKLYKSIECVRSKRSKICFALAQTFGNGTPFLPKVSMWFYWVFCPCRKSDIEHQSRKFNRSTPICIGYRLQTSNSAHTSCNSQSGVCQMWGLSKYTTSADGTDLETRLVKSFSLITTFVPGTIEVPLSKGLYTLYDTCLYPQPPNTQVCLIIPPNHVFPHLLKKESLLGKNRQ